MNRSQLRKLIRETISEMVSPFYETLSAALDAVDEYIEKNKIVLDPNEHPEGIRGINEPFSTGGIPYETTKNGNFKLLSYKGKPTRKYLHIDIYRTENGRYELNTYVL